MITKMKIVLTSVLVLASASAALAEGRHHYRPYAQSPYAQSPFAQNSQNTQYDTPGTQNLLDGGR